jgi:hypothetical protein
MTEAHLEDWCLCAECQAKFDAKSRLRPPLPKDLQRQVDDGLITAEEAERFRDRYED